MEWIQRRIDKWEEETPGATVKKARDQWDM
jgi:hypothetical protein